MTTRPFSPTLRVRPRRSAALGAGHVKADELKGSPGIDSLESGSGRTVVSSRSAGSEKPWGHRATRRAGATGSTRDKRDDERRGSASWQGDEDVEMDRDDNRARGDRLLSPRVTFNPGSEPRGSSFGHVLLPDASRAFQAKAVGTGVKFRHRIGRTAATDDRPHDRLASDGGRRRHRALKRRQSPEPSGG